MRIALKISYQGTRFCGWQVQAGTNSGDKPSVQQTLQEALRQMTQHPVNLIASGRTDSGVHAVGQVAHFDTEKKWDVEKIQKGLNSILPPDIRVIQALAVSDEFHAQMSAQKKKYIYTFLQGPCELPILSHQCLWIRRSLDVEKMNEAANLLIGEKDFKPFQAAGASVKTTIRRILESRVIQEKVSYPKLEGFSFVHYEVIGTGFLKQMVRGIAGTLLDIGEGKKDPSIMSDIIETQDRSKLGATASAKGLCLSRVWYPNFE